MALVRFLLLAAVALCARLEASAHNLPYALAKLTIEDDGSWRLEIACHTAALITGLPQGHLPPGARAALEAMPDEDVAGRAGLMADYLRQAIVLNAGDNPLAPPAPRFPSVAEIRDDGRMTPETARPSAPVALEGRLPPGTKSLSVSFPPLLGTVLLNIAGGTPQALAPGETSTPVRIGATADPVATGWQYAALGFEHILPKGLDHILFVLCLFLLSPHWSALAWQVTAFTVAHSVTLALAVFGLIDLPARLIETLIALSIAVVAVDNIRASELARWRPLVVFLFGLLHGMGFAGVLADMGLPVGEEALALVAFNVGIEVGQLAVLAIAFAGLFWTIGKSWRRRYVAIPASIAIALVAVGWTVERALQ